ncbi:MAG: heat-inducible transcriptional repressor HrcA [Christensenellaceae bacterium]|nr:heat-inducible transcriptional repressor HrcA [Christensenellaceae bacterium]
MALDMRKMRILQAIIDDYILTASPVGSRTISKLPGIALSSATIRNEMSDLEEMGYLEQPHTSAGRIPSEKAYRLYVNSIMRQAALLEEEKRFIQDCYSSTLDKVDEVVKQTAWVLSSMTKYTSMVLTPQLQAVKIRHIQLVPVGEGRALVVVVTDAGITRDSLINVPLGMTPSQLERISHILTERLRNCTVRDIRAVHIPELQAELQGQREFLDASLETLQKSMDAGPDGVQLSGATNMLSYPEYSDMGKARAFLNAIETRDVLYSLLNEATNVEFSITIGAENKSAPMQDCSVVTATYKVGDTSMGSLGVIGPVRMNYGRVLALMNHIGKSLSAVLTNMFDEERK